jgi:hypothetical protein
LAFLSHDRLNTDELILTQELIAGALQAEFAKGGHFNTCWACVAMV